MTSVKRRAFLGAAVLGALAALPFAAAAAEAPVVVDVVKVMAFSCPVCRAAEVQDKVIEQAVKEAGGRFVWAPVPNTSADSGSKERLYYASRAFSPQLAERVKDVLYKGMQDLSIPLLEMPQVYVYFQQQFHDIPEVQFNELFNRAQEKDARQSLARAATLAQTVGVVSVPSYIILADGRPVASLDPESVSGGSLTTLREEVINRIRKLSK